MNTQVDIKDRKQLPLFLTPKDLCELLNISLTTAYRLANAGSIPCVRVGDGRKILIPRDKLFRYLEEG